MITTFQCPTCERDRPVGEYVSDWDCCGECAEEIEIWTRADRARRQRGPVAELAVIA